MYSELFKKTYDVLKWTYSVTNNFPKKQRLILAQRIEIISIRILELVIDLPESDTTEKRKRIKHEIQKMQVLCRVSKDLSYMSFKDYEHTTVLLNELSKILNGGGGAMQTYRNLYEELCSFRNLYTAYRKASRNKHNKKSVIEFEIRLESELLQLKHELETMIYQPRPLKQFVIRDPKTRLISASHFRDRVVHHALCNVIEPIFDEIFINDSYANRAGKGTLAALQRFDNYQRKISGNGKPLPEAKDNNQIYGYALKADIRHYFDSVDHEILLKITSRKIKDEKTIWLIKKIIDSHVCIIHGKGMPIGNLTSQFFANVYLNELDCFVKHELKAKFYIRYVDDFVILDVSKQKLELYKSEIAEFLESIKLELHPQKSKIVPLHAGVQLLGFRIFYNYKLLKRSNARRIPHRLKELTGDYANGMTEKDDIFKSFDGWNAYAMHANTYKFRKLLRKNLGRDIRRIDTAKNSIHGR